MTLNSEHDSKHQNSIDIYYRPKNFKNNLGNHQVVQEANMTQPGHRVERIKVVRSVKHPHDTHEDLFKIWIGVRISEKIHLQFLLSINGVSVILSMEEGRVSRSLDK